MGMFLLKRVYEGYLSRKATRDLPVDGVKKGLVGHGQAGQFYRHLYFHIGCRFLGWPGMLASWFMGQCGGVRVRAGSVGPVATEDIATGGGGAVAGDPGGMMEKATISLLWKAKIHSPMCADDPSDGRRG
jgi:hypothetical protein